MTEKLGKTRSTLELLLLSLVQDGLRTSYDLKAKAGLSLGSTVPALARLESEGLLRASSPASRNSRDFQITSSGIRALNVGWRQKLASAADIDSAVRLAYLALKNRAPKEASSILRNVSSTVTGLAKIFEAEAALFDTSSHSDYADTYRWLRSRVEGARLRGAGAELGRLADKLSNSQKQIRGGKKRSKTPAK